MAPLPRPTRRELLQAGTLAGASLALTPNSSGQSHADSVRRATLQAYRTLHAHPELGKQEQFAKAYLEREMRALQGMKFVDVSGLPTALLAVLDTGRGGKTIVLRAELDARRLDTGVVEPAHHDPRSSIDGLMHNCGHDAHAAVLLGAATELSRIRRDLRGRIVFLFQPAEETQGGADDIVASGILDKLGVDAVFAQHCVPGLPVGEIQLSAGTFLAGSTAFTLTLRGAASHAAAPQDGSDLPLVAARVISELASFPARKLDIINRPLVISTTQMSTNAETINGLPSEVVLRGTIRAFEDVERAPANGQSIASLLRENVERLANASGAEASLELRRGSPPTHNDERLHGIVYPILKKRFGSAISSPNYRGMFSEDFAFYSQAYPSLYFSLGIFKDGLGSVGVHRPDFTLHPDALAVGADLMITIARDVCREL